MAQIQKPVDLSLVWASAGDVLNPGSAKYQTGWQVEIPPRQWENYIQNKQDQAIAHINQHGIPMWDSATEYQYGVSGAKSIVMGSDGTIYRAKQTNTNQDPTTDTTDTYWEIAFANTGDFYTKTQTDTNYLAKSGNLSDLTNTATARTNLGVYSQAQTYTKSEVDSKTTIASTIQAQDQSSNTTLLTPLRLMESFKGDNQSLTANGYQELPGGVLIQWGIIPAGTDNMLVTFPKQFTSINFGVQCTDYAGMLSVGTSNLTLTSFNLRVGSTAAVRWFAIGV